MVFFWVFMSPPWVEPALSSCKLGVVTVSSPSRTDFIYFQKILAKKIYEKRYA